MLTDNDLISRMRTCADIKNCVDCPELQKGCKGESEVLRIGADRIMELQQIAEHHEQTAKDYWKEACEYKAQLPKHGEWVKNEDRCGWHCSCCNVDNNYAYSWNSETGKNDFQDNYCPNCGAKMGVQE